MRVIPQTRMGVGLFPWGRSLYKLSVSSFPPPNSPAELVVSGEFPSMMLLSWVGRP